VDGIPNEVSMPTAVIAFGGNAFVPEGASGAYEEQAATIEGMTHVVTDLYQVGYHVVVVHGNGPQVGALAIQHEEAADLVPRQPLFVLDAMTQGQLGHLLTVAIRNRMGHAVPVSAVITNVLVWLDDREFAQPTKPIGPFYAPEEAQRLARDRGWTVRRVSDRACRRVVASPRPREVLEIDSVRALAAAGVLIVAGGGGGIPVVRDGGRLRGVEAVIDKDRVACLLASALGAELLVLVTGVTAVALNFGTLDERQVDEMTVDEARTYLDDGHFPAGSMGPKIESAMEFVAAGGELAVITSDQYVTAALEGRHGTRIVAGPARHARAAAG
jgi:carbamate kinase